jgi:hypothetical protein
MSDSQENAAVAAILDRYWELCGAHERAQENICKLQAHQRELMAEINDCSAAARLFGLDLARPAIPRAGPNDQSVKAMVLQAAEDAHPQPVQASEVRRQLARQGYVIHEKTVGMTLYRWSLAGRVRRDGLDWYFVPHGTHRQSIGCRGVEPEPEQQLAAALAH